ncbi:MAG: peptidase, partial [Deltaproteobacteria bacterium]|nr:peptidase [Deltaproteobacteria bacterium]
MAKLMDRFVCVRLVKANALDLEVFRFDYDMTFAVFLMNADRGIYGRFGSRSKSGAAVRHFSLEAFRKALVAALELHAGYPRNRESLKGKRGPRSRFRVPEDFPYLKRYGPDLNYNG